MRWSVWLLGLVFLISGGVGLGCWWVWRPQVEVLRLPGVVEMQEVRLGSKLGGRVAEVKTAEGKIVEAGEVLIVFDQPELRARREQLLAKLASAEAELDKAKKGPRDEEIESARAAAESARARFQRMKAGSRAEEVRQARSELEMAEDDLRLARQDFDRADRLFRQGSLARADYDLARAADERTQHRTEMLRARVELLEIGNRQEDIDEAAAELKKWEANYRLLLAGSRPEDIAAAAASVAEVKGKLQEVEANLAEGTVTAPERSLVEVLAVRKGDVVPPNTAVIRVLRADDLWVKVYVTETALGKVRLNQAVKVSVDAYPGEELDGTVIQIAGVSEFMPRNVQSADERKHQVFGIKVRVDDPHGIFKSGMAAEVIVPLQESNQ
jgi:multidrug resistance efflux pump